MSGGAFDYNQYRIDDIIERIEREIHDATKPRPDIQEVKCITVWETVEEYDSIAPTYHPFCALKTLDEVRNAMKKQAHTIKVLEDEGDKITFTECGKTLYVYENVDYRYPDEYTEETLNEFRKGVEILKQGRIYTQRIDWLISGDDGEESFHERLKEELEKLKKY